MPYYSFSLKQNYFLDEKFKDINSLNLQKNTGYCSKNTNLWKILNKKKFLQYINYVKFEKRQKINRIGKKILFCLPPSIGLGDAIEYALAIKTIKESKFYDKVAVAFVGRYKIIFEKYFNLFDIYSDVISENQLLLFDTVFHVSLEINEFKNQKYIRSDIEKTLLEKFNLKISRNIISKQNFQIKKITIFPISKSPLRTLSVNIINEIIRNYINAYDIEIVLDDHSDISVNIEKNLNLFNVTVLKPLTLIDLCKEIENIQFGVFPDSGPLHLAKILNKKGLLVTTTVHEKILLNNFDNINVFSNNYKSKFCNSPCGLTNIFNNNGSYGCYDSLSINSSFLLDKNLNSLQRGDLKNRYLDFIDHPVGCIRNINIDNLINKINSSLGI